MKLLANYNMIIYEKKLQLDITAEFEVDKESLERVQKTSEVYDCKNSGGASRRGALGPFGLLILADKDLSEQTPIYFYIAKGSDGNLKTFFCADHSRSVYDLLVV